MSRFLSFVSSLTFAAFVACVVLATATMMPRGFASEPLTVEYCPDTSDYTECIAVVCDYVIGQYIQCIIKYDDPSPYCGCPTQ